MIHNSFRRGQSIVEIVIALTIVGVIITTAVVALAIVLRSNAETQQSQSATLLAQEYADIVQNLSIGNWDALYLLTPKGATSTFRVAASGTTYVVQSGNSTTTLDGIVYTRYFSVQDVSRDAATHDIEVAYNLSNDDPSTQKISIYTTWTRGGTARSLSIVKYVTRWQNRTFEQTTWSGGSATDTVVGAPDNSFSTSTNVDTESSFGSLILEGF
jgi:type II secretory pathway pseudopilin PulG